MVSEEILNARRDLVRQTMAKIREFREFTTFTTHVEVEFMHLGLQYKPETKIFLESCDWSDPSQMDECLREIERFLTRMIR